MGYELIKKSHKPEEKENPLTMENMVKRFSKRNIPITTILDVGASNGIWTERTMPFFPDSHFLLLEANQNHKNDLETIKRKYKNLDYILKAVGEKNGNIYFDADDLFGGLAYEKKLKESMIEIPVINLDTCIKEKSLPGPYLIKLDTHGIEKKILDGSKEILKNTSCLIIESYNFNLLEDSLNFYELCNYLDAKGFRPVDISDIMLRELDQALWQFDLLFIRKEHTTFKNNNYK